MFILFNDTSKYSDPLPFTANSFFLPPPSLLDNEPPSQRWLIKCVININWKLSQLCSNLNSGHFRSLLFIQMNYSAS
jgi:hypothetical protein